MKKYLRYLIIMIPVIVLSQAFAAQKAVVVPLKKAQKADNVITVLAKGGDYTDPIAAINSITDASATNPYLVLIGPGIYTLNQTLAMKPYVSIAGSGRDATTLRGAISTGILDATSATVSGADNSTLHDLSVVNTGGGAYSIAIYNNTSSPVIHDVSAAASGGTQNYGVYNLLSFSVMKNISITASGGTKSYGVRNNGSPVDIINVTTEASAADYNYGVYNSLSSLSMTEVIASASGGYLSYSYGVYNNNSSPKMTDVTAKASGETVSYGVYNDSSSPEMIGVTAIASGGLENIGIKNISSSPLIQHSTIDNISVDGGTTKIMLSSILHGANILSGTLKCANVDDGVETALSDTCQ